MKAGVALLLLCCLLQLHAADNPVSIDMYADSEQADIGDEIQLHIIYKWPKEWTPSAAPDPAMVLSNNNLFIVNAPPVEHLSDGEFQQARWTFTILAQRSGAWSLPRPGFQVTAPNGAVHTATAPELILQVGIDETAPRLSPPSASWTSDDSAAAGLRQRYWLWISILCILIAGGIILWRLRQQQDVVTLKPIELFEQEINKARASSDGKEAAAFLSHAVRDYCGRIWSFDGIGSTHREMRQHLTANLEADELRRIFNLLDQLESMRWTPAEMQKNQIDQLIEDAVAWCNAQEARMRAAAEAAADQTDRTPASGAAA